MDISIVIPLYNKEKHILDTINCILNQTFQRFEIVVIDDGSTDKSVEKLNSINDHRIRLISQTNSGAALARNRGVAEATNEHVAFMDADDQWDKDYLESMLKLIKKYPKAVLYGTNYRIVENGEISVLKYPNIDFEEGIIENYFISGKVYTPLWTSAVVVKKTEFQKIGGFPVECKICEDIDLWCRMASIGEVAYLNEAKATYRRDSSNMLSRSKNASSYFPFLDDYQMFFEREQAKYDSVKEFVTYRKLMAISYALFTSHNKTEARKILRAMDEDKKYRKKIVVYNIFSYAPIFMLELYCFFRRMLR